MPYSVKKNHGKCMGDKPYAVVKDSDGEIMGCHETSEAAGSQIGAIEANEKKSKDDKSKDNKSIYDWYAPYGVTSFTQLDAMKDAAEKAKNIRNLTDQFQSIVDNIVCDSEIANKGVAIEAVTGEYLSRMQNMENSEEYEGEAQKALDKIDAQLLITKGDDGTYYWDAIYSNDKKDLEEETISTKSHKTFVEMVEKGIAPLPELWHWHIPGTKWGQATEVSFDEKGRARAKGYVLEGHEKEAEALKGRTDIRVSHGMPMELIRRDKRDDSTIIRHVTVEISDLLAGHEANQGTGFVVMKGTEMKLTDEQKEYLKGLGYSDEDIPSFESLASTKDLKQKDDGKDNGGEDQDENNAPATRQEVADAVAEITSGFMQAIEATNKSLTDLTARVNGMLEADGRKVADKASKTPPASLKSLILQRVIESGDTKITPDSQLAKSKPEETHPDNDTANGLFFESWMNNGR